MTMLPSKKEIAESRKLHSNVYKEIQSTLRSYGPYIVNKSVTTASIYVKFSAEGVGSLRIGDHASKKYSYRWNIRSDLKEAKCSHPGTFSSDYLNLFYKSFIREARYKMPLTIVDDQAKPTDDIPPELKQPAIKCGQISAYTELIKRALGLVGDYTSRDFNSKLELNVGCLSAEAGEVFNEAKRVTWQKLELDEARRLKILTECSDTFFHLLATLDLMGSDIHEIAEIGARKAISRWGADKL